jgi:hypothetical protein
MEGKKLGKSLGFSQIPQNVAKAERFCIIFLHLKMEAIETGKIESENHFLFSIQ